MTTSNRELYKEATRLIRQGHSQNAIAKIATLLDAHPTDEIGLSILGSALLRLDRLDDALAVFKRAVDAHPASFAAHGDLGFAHMTAGNKARAIAAFEKAVALNGRFYQGWCYLGRLQFAIGEYRQSEDSFRLADACDPFNDDYRDIQNATSDSRFANAEKIARAILSRQPGHPKASFALAHLASRVGAFEEAAQILSEAIENFPCDMNLRAALVNSFEEVGDYERALGEAERAAELSPESSSCGLAVGRVHGHCGHYVEALAAYDKALTLIASGNSAEQGNLELLRGHILKILGRHSEAARAYRASIDAIEGNGAGWWGLADMKTYRFDENDVLAMQDVCGNTELKAAQRTQAAFALGKAFEDRGMYDEAFDWYRMANELRPDVRFSFDEFFKGIDEIVSTFTPDMIGHRAASGTKEPTPIFIVGLPRSGSTLIEQILASHSQVEGTMELGNVPNLLRRIRIDGGRRKATYPSSLTGFTTDEFAAYGQAYLDETAIYRTGKPFFIDKMPTNFDKVGMLQMILPDAIFIDARRHPLDCGFSCFKQHFAGGHYFSYSLENIAHYYNGYLKLMDHWDRVMPGKVFCVRYEQLIERTEDIVRALLQHCGLAFEDSCLRFFENDRPVRTASSEQVRQPIYNKSVGHWRNFEGRLETLVRTLGPATLSRFGSDHA